MLVYIEYVSRLAGVSLEGFHEIAGRGETGWASAYADDQLILNIGRSWRVGPEPEYLVVWYTSNAGLDRIDEWERIFVAGEAAVFDEPFRVVARIETGGCYEPLLEPIAGTTERYYGEFFDFAPAATRDDVRRFFENRRLQHADLTLNLVVDRIGKLGPDPRGLAIWSLPSYAQLEAIARELDDVEQPIRLQQAALYADFGKEIL